MRRMMWVLVCVSSLVVAGCGRKPDESDVQPSMLDTFCAEIGALQEAQGTEAAVLRMRALLDDPAYGEIRSSVFQRLLETMLGQGLLAETQSFYLQRGGSDPDLALAGFNLVMQASLSEDAQASAAWLEQVIGSCLPPDLRAVAWQSRMVVYAQTGSVAPVAGRLAEIMKDDIAPSAPAVLRTALSHGLRIADYDGVDAVLAALAAYTAANPELDKRAQMAKGDVLMARGLPAEALEHFLDKAQVFGDSDLGRRFSAVFKAAGEKNMPELARRVVDAAYQRGSEFPSARDAVAALDVGVAADSGVAAVLLQAAQAALDHGVALSRIYHLFSRGFYNSIQHATADAQEALLAFVRRMRQLPDLPETIQSVLATAELDGCYITQNYKGVLAVLDGGVPGFDEAWHTELRNKVYAHLALQEGRIDDAVALFQKHIESIKAWETPVTNPENGRQVSREVVLGFNEKRIGDILAGVAGREAEARAAYARARKWYQDGLALLAPDSPDYASAAAELATVPATE